MLSPTRDDMKTFGYAAPEEMREASRRVLNLWVGAISPLWAPFWLTSSIGVGLWTAAQTLKQIQTAARTSPDALAESSGGVTDVAGTVQDMVREGLIAPVQMAVSAVEQTEKLVEEQTPSAEALVHQMEAVSDKVTQTAVAQVDNVATSEVAAETITAVSETAKAAVTTAEAAASTSDAIINKAFATPDVAIPAKKTPAKTTSVSPKPVANALSVANAPKPEARKPRKS